MIDLNLSEVKSIKSIAQSVYRPIDLSIYRAAISSYLQLVDGRDGVGVEDVPGVQQGGVGQGQGLDLRLQYLHLLHLHARRWGAASVAMRQEALKWTVVSARTVWDSCQSASD